SFAADDAEPSHHFAQESPQPCNLINLVAYAYKKFLTEPYLKNFWHSPEAQVPTSDTGIFKSSVGFDYAKRFEDCHCEAEARSNLQLIKTEIASSFHSSQ
ncbi:MAG TPA: hypothetical protein VK463_18895, partial [Desulfomonilaceae bacterium]|nr:hypothetical protein [Desulfomonilaceae bacterium]